MDFTNDRGQWRSFIRTHHSQNGWSQELNIYIYNIYTHAIMCKYTHLLSLVTKLMPISTRTIQMDKLQQLTVL